MHIFYINIWRGLLFDSNKLCKQKQFEIANNHIQVFSSIIDFFTMNCALITTDSIQIQKKNFVSISTGNA